MVSSAGGGLELPRTRHGSGSGSGGQEAVWHGEHCEQVRCDRCGGELGYGTLNFEGKTHAFSIDGLTVVDLGISSVTTTGEVFNLSKLSDFNGNYVAGAAGIAIAGGANEVIMKNEHGVVLRMRGTEKGAKLTLGPHGVKITLKN